MTKKYIKCFSKENADKLKTIGFAFLYEQNGVFYFTNEDDSSKNIKFSNCNFSDDDVVYTARLNF